METSVGHIGLEIAIEEQRAEEEVTASVLVNEHRVLADPAEPSAPGKIALKQRGRIDDGPPARFRPSRLHPIEEFLQLQSEHDVVIQATRVASDLSSGSRGLAIGIAPFCLLTSDL